MSRATAFEHLSAMAMSGPQLSGVSQLGNVDSYCCRTASELLVAALSRAVSGVRTVSRGDNRPFVQLW